MQKALDAGAYYNIIRGTGDISPLSYIIRQNLTEISFSLRFAVREKTFILAQGAFQISLPEIKTEAFSVYAGGRKIIQTGRFFWQRSFFLYGSAGQYL